MSYPQPYPDEWPPEPEPALPRYEARQRKGGTWQIVRRGSDAAVTTRHYATQASARAAIPMVKRWMERRRIAAPQPTEGKAA